MMASEIPAAPVEAATAEDTAQAVEAQKQAAVVEALRTVEEQSAKEKAQAARREIEQARQERERAIAEKAQARPEAVTPETRGVMTEASELRAQAEAERDRLQALGNEYDLRLRRERERDRISSLRGMGAVGSLTDEQLLAITPDVDPHAPGGKAQLDDWRERNAGLFIVEEVPRIPTPAEMIGHLTVKKSASGLYDEAFLARLLKDNLGGG